MSLAILFNAADISGQKVYIGGSPDNWLSSPVSTRSVARAPNRVRGVRSRSDTIDTRLFALPVFVNTFTFADRTTATDYLKSFFRQTVTIRMDDGVTAREIIGDVISVPLVPRDQPNNTVVVGTFNVQCPESSWRSTSGSTVTGIASATTIALGTAPVEDWVLGITGTLTGPITVTFAGPKTLTMTYNTNLAAGHTLTITPDTGVVLDNSTDVSSHWSGGFQPLDPMGGVTPVTIAIAAASGTPSGTLTYVKRWY